MTDDTITLTREETQKVLHAVAAVEHGLKTLGAQPGWGAQMVIMANLTIIRMALTPGLTRYSSEN